MQRRSGSLNCFHGIIDILSSRSRLRLVYRYTIVTGMPLAKNSSQALKYYFAHPHWYWALGWVVMQIQKVGSKGHGYGRETHCSRDEQGWKMQEYHNNTERHTAHPIVSWPNPEQWVRLHNSDLMMIIRQSIYIISIITRKMGKLKTHSPIYCMIYNWENMLYLTHLYLTSPMSSDRFAQWW